MDPGMGVIHGFNPFSVAYYAFLIATPFLFLFLAVSARGRDRLSVVVLAAFAAVFALNFLAVGPLRLWSQALSVLWLFPLGVGGLVFRMARDRRRKHERSTGESLAVLTLGTIFLAMILAVPSMFLAVV